MDDRSSARALMQLIRGYRLSQAVTVAARLEIADHLADGPRSVGELAEATGTHRDSLLRLLRALASAGLFVQDADGRFALGAIGRHLRSSSPLHAWAIFYGQPYYWEAWMALEHSVRTGENAFRHVHGQSIWDYRRSHPEEGAIFDRAMEAGTATANRAILDAYDFGRFEKIVDVGGGNGGMIAAILAHAPTLRGILFDQPHVVSTELLERDSVRDRCEIVGGSFFETVPEGGDCYLMKAIIHDWEDAEARAILASCRRAMRPGATLLVIDRDLRDGEGYFSDLNMLVAPGGRERTSAEFAELFRATGFRPERTIPTRSRMSIFEATAI